MKPLFTKIVYCCLIFFAGNACAQNDMVDIQTAKFTGKTIMEYLHLPDFKVLPDSNARKYCTDERCYYYTADHVVFAQVMNGDPGAENEDAKAKYKKLVDQYNSLQTMLGDPSNQEKDTDQKTIFTWKGFHCVITAVNDKNSKLISITFTDNNLAPK